MKPHFPGCHDTSWTIPSWFSSGHSTAYQLNSDKFFIISKLFFSFYILFCLVDLIHAPYHIHYHQYISDSWILSLAQILLPSFRLTYPTGQLYSNISWALQDQNAWNQENLSSSNSFSSLTPSNLEIWNLVIPFSSSTVSICTVVNHSLTSANITYISQGWHLGEINIAWFVRRRKSLDLRVDGVVKLWSLSLSFSR